MIPCEPSLLEFGRLAKANQGKTIPVYCQLVADNLTPVTAFSAIAGHEKDAFLLESVEGGKKIGRYTFLATKPRLVFEATRQRVSLQDRQGIREEQSSDPLARLAEVLDTCRAVHLMELPRFAGGAVGYAAYDVVRYYESLPNSPTDDLNVPDLRFGLYDTMVVFDHVVKTIKVISHAHVEADGVEGGYKRACNQVANVVDKLEVPQKLRMGWIAPQGDPKLTFTSNFAPGEFQREVEACKEYIRAGDIFQVVLSQRLSVETPADPFDIYRALRIINPSPFMFYLKSPKVILVGASPEIMCRVEDGVITSRPLAGTRRRGKDEKEDRALKRELLQDPKERAEHIMLVDLARNDVGRVAELGSVRVNRKMFVERYSHVMHICSNVSGKLATGMTAFDALRAALPVGTVSGAPKVRAMQIIDEFEPTRRGPYAGAVGYVDFAGNMDTCIALRTMVIKPEGGGPGRHQAYVQAGAGIVADSEPQREYEETINKAKGLLKAIEVAENWRYSMSTRVLSCIQPTGELHIGNYFGAIENWVTLQNTHRCIYGIVDLHAMTMPYDPVQLDQNTQRMAIDLLACGVDPEKAILFVQSLVPEHTELCWILSCLCPFGELRRMTQFKEKATQLEEGKSGEFISSGLFIYPILQAADILAYRANYVPVGRDQEQHLELSRVIARRFNQQYTTGLFPEPQPLFTTTPKIMSLVEPLKKMSKSAGNNHYIGVFEEEESIRKKLKGAVTDSGDLAEGTMSSGVANLLEILRACGNTDEYKQLFSDCEAGKRRYGDLKAVVADALVKLIVPLRARRQELVRDSEGVQAQIQEMSAKAREIANDTLREVRKLVGLPPRSPT